MYQEEKSMKTIAICLILFLLLGGGALVKLVILPAYMANKAADAAYGVVDKTLDPNNVIFNYEYFKTQYEAFNSINTKIQVADAQYNNFLKTLPNDKEKWAKSDRDELSRLQTIADGLRFQRADIVADYNAKSKMINRAIFKDRGLPDLLVIPQ